MSRRFERLINCVRTPHRGLIFDLGERQPDRRGRVHATA